MSSIPNKDFCEDATGEKKSAYFPRRFLTDFFDFLARHRRDVELLTYADLPWGEDANYGDGYPGEYCNWRKQLARGERDPTKAYLLIQYDVDSWPERTMDLLGEPGHAQIPANIMIFNRRIDRRRLNARGELRFTDYPIDEARLLALEAKGFVVGYHINAYEQALFDVDRALEIFERDVRELSQRFNIRHVSAHGGVPDSRGRNNRDLPFPPHLAEQLKWVHNGHSIRLKAQFSDGGHNSLRLDPKTRDLRDFVATMRPSFRYRILLHPQYYDAMPRPSPRFAGTPWYDELLELNATSPDESLWRDARLG